MPEIITLLAYTETITNAHYALVFHWEVPDAPIHKRAIIKSVCMARADYDGSWRLRLLTVHDEVFTYMTRDFAHAERLFEDIAKAMVNGEHLAYSPLPVCRNGWL